MIDTDCCWSDHIQRTRVVRPVTEYDMNNSFSSADLSSESKCTTRQDRLSSFSPAVHSPGSLSLEALDIGAASGHMHAAAQVMRTRFDSSRDYCLTVSPEPPAGVIGQPRSASALANRPSHSLSIPSPPISATATASASGQRGVKEQGGNGTGDVNGMVTEITQNLRRLADMIERNGYTGQLPLPNSPALTPSPSGQRPVFPLAGPTGNLDQLAPFINLDPIALRNLEMLARVADHNSPAAQPVPTSSHSTSLLQNPVMPVLDHRISPLLNPMHCSPTPPNSSTNTPTPPVAFNRMGKVNVMQIRCKFGQLGTYKGQFSSPHGFCLGMDEEIVIADTNNHRICVYDKAGEFKHSFGIAGKDEGQLWYPRKVAFIRTSNSLSSPRYVICDRGSERSRMQIFTRNGHFIRKIAIRYIDIVAGLAITPAGHIVAVDSVSPTVFVIAETGDLLRWFDCSEHMREPSDVAVANNEFYICDFKGHCVVVFSEEGQFLRRIGHEHLTNFPNGIDVSDAGDILIGDSHGNRFHVVVFDNSGSLLGEFECPYVKVSRCCGLKITSEGYVVTLAKNNHHVLILNTLYII